MVNIRELLQYYPESQQAFREFILREYLQHKILQIVFDVSTFANKLCFLGGTCLRIVHGNKRFSEDIDFDNLGLTEQSFQQIADRIVTELTREGYTVEMKTIYRSAYHCYIRFPNLLFQEGLSGHQEAKILIQLDTEPQHFDFKPEKFILNKFDVFTEINVTPLDLLLAQKFFSILNRKRSLGRDFFDVIFLLSKQVKPNYDYLTFKSNIADAIRLKKTILDKCANLDMRAMANDVSPFLFDPADARKVTLFEEYIKQVDL